MASGDFSALALRCRGVAGAFEVSDVSGMSEDVSGCVIGAYLVFGLVCCRATTELSGSAPDISRAIS